jgi:amidase
MDEDELAFAGVTGQAALVADGTISSVELVTALLRRIERLNPILRAFRIVLADEAPAEAAERDGAPGHARGKLHGVPIAIKDEIDVAGQITTFGSAARTARATADAEVVARLRAAGAVIIGMTAMPEFGAFPFTESQAYGITRNPWDITRTTGGSSGGTAAVVAAGMAAAGLGGDGGGSIRIPAACCGLFGLKPTRGLVPIAPLWHDLGTTGPLTRTVTDSALIYDVLRGPPSDPDDAFARAAVSEPRPTRIAFSAKSPQRGVRVHHEQAVALQATADTLRALGHEVVERRPDHPDLTLAFIPQAYGGIRDESLLVERPELLERRTKQAIAFARALLPPPAVKLAIGHGRRIAERVNRLFADGFDALLTPTIAPLPGSIGILDGVSNPRALLRSLPYAGYTALWNVCGNPAASVPAGVASNGLPLAVQLIARPGAEATILQLAAQLERARPWADRRPPEPVPPVTA